MPVVTTAMSTMIVKKVGVVTHANLHAGIRTVMDYLGITGGDRIASLLPFSFVYGVSQLNCAIATGATLEVVDTAFVPPTSPYRCRRCACSPAPADVCIPRASGRCETRSCTRRST